MEFPLVPLKPDSGHFNLFYLHYVHRYYIKSKSYVSPVYDPKLVPF